MRFEDLIRPGMMVRDVKQQYPESKEIFERHGFRGSCDDCTIEQVSRKYDLNSLDVVAELNQTIFGKPE